MKSPLFSPIKSLIAIAFIFFFNSNIYAACDAEAGPDTTVCGFTYLLEGLPNPGTWDIICDQSAGIVHFTPMSPFDALVTITDCGYYNFVYTVDDGVCIGMDTVEVLFLDPSSASYSVNQVIDLDYDYECHQDPPISCDYTNVVGIGGLEPPAFNWTFSLTGNCASNIFETFPININGCLADTIQVDTASSTGTYFTCDMVTQDSLIDDFFGYTDSICALVLNSLTNQCTVPFANCPSPPASPSECFHTFNDTNYYYIPVREGGQWTLVQTDTADLLLEDSTLITVDTSDYLFIIDPGADYYGPDSIFFSLFRINELGELDTLEVQVTLTIQWIEFIRVDTIVDINVITIDTCAISCGGTSVFKNFGQIPEPPIYDCSEGGGNGGGGPLTLNFGPPDPCEAANVMASITAGTNWLTCDNPCTELYASGSSQCGPVTLSWEQQFVCSGGVYTVTATDENGCTATAEIYIDECTWWPFVDAGPDKVLTCIEPCAQLEPQYDNWGWTWVEWQGPNGFFSSDPNATVCEPGNYQIMITNDCGCTAWDQVTILEDMEEPIVDAGPDMIITCIDPCVTLLGSVSSANGATTSWSGPGIFGSSDLNPSVCVPGVYTLTAIDNFNGCESTNSVTVTNDMSISTTNLEASICEGDCFEMDNQLYCNSGIYTTTFLSSQGCDSIVTLNLEVNEAPNGSINGDPSFCFGQSTTCYAPSSFATYQWSDGSIGQSININSPGIFSLTVTNASGCTSVNSVSIIEIPPPNVTISGATIFCSGDQTVLDAGSGFSNYQWSDNSSGQSLNADASGTYSVTVTDFNGCTNFNSITISEIPPPNVTISGSATFCSGSATVLDAGSGFSNYQWSDNSSEQSLNADASGTYSVTVTDFNGCSGVDEIVVNETAIPPTQIAESICQGSCYVIDNQTFCNTGIYDINLTSTSGCDSLVQLDLTINDIDVQMTVSDVLNCNNSSVSIDANGSTSGIDVTYNWSGSGIMGNPNASSIQVNQAGTYTLTLNNGNCSNSQSIIVEENIESPIVDAGPSQEINCNNACVNLLANASINVGNLDFEWTGPNGFSSTELNPSVCTQGDYTLVVTASNGCVATDAVNVNEIMAIPPTQLTESICDGNCYIIGNQTFCTTGNYDINFTSVLGCDSLVQLNLTVEQTSIQIEATDVLTCNTPFVTIDASGSVAGSNVSYNWSGSGIMSDPNASSIQVNQAGNYTLTLNNGNCSNAQSVTVVENVEQPIVDAGPSQEINCNNACVNLLANASINVGNLDFEWTGPNGFSSTELNPSVCTQGDYTLVVTASNGCVATDAVNVNEIMAIPPTQLTESICDGNCYIIGNQTFCTTGNYDINFTSVLGCDSLVQLNLTVEQTSIQIEATDVLTCNTPFVTIDASGSVAGNNVSYNWSGSGIMGNPNASSIQVNQAGNYTLTLNNGNCSNTQSVTVVENVEQPIVDAGPSQEINCNNACVNLLANASINVGNLDFEWTGPNGFSSTELNPSVCTQGDYTLVVTASNGCVATDAVNVNEIMAIPPTQLTESICDGNCYIIGNQTFCTTGNYEVNFTSVLGCDSLVQLNLTVEQTSIQIEATDVLTCNTSFVTIDASGSVAGNNVSYNWSGSGIMSDPNASSIQVNQAGNYTLTLNNGNCSNAQSVTVVENVEQPSVDAGPSQEINCNNACVNLLANASINVGNLDFEWTGPNGFSSTELNPSVCTQGDYTLVVTANNGCVATDAVYVNEIMAIPPTQLTESICLGDCFSIGSLSFCNTGDYEVNLTSTLGCDSLVQLNLTIEQTSIQIAATDVLTCNTPLVTIDASGSAAGNNVSYNWSGSGIVGDPNASSVQVNEAGTYTLTLSNGNCSNAQSVTVVEDMELPSISIQPIPEIDCNHPCVTLPTNISGTGNFSYLWTGPNGFSSNESNPMVCNPGLYNLVITGDNGCDTNADLQVNEAIVQLSSSMTSSICAGDCVTIGTETFCESGDYEISMLTTNGCDSVVNLELTVLATSIDIQDPGQLNCINAVLTLDASASVAGSGISYTWSSPNGQLMGNPNNPIIQTATPGTYVLSLDNNGCIEQQSIVVFQEIDTLLVNGGIDLDLDCNTQTAQLTPTLESVEAPFIVQWSGPNGFDSNQLNPEVATAGLYTIHLINTSNGCSAEDVVKINEGIQLTIVGESEGSCSDNATGTIVVEDIFNGIAPYQFAIDGNDFQSTPLFTDVAVGNHQVEVIDAMGCTTQAEISVDALDNFALDIAPLYQTCAEEGVQIQPILENNPLAGEMQYLWSDGATEAVRSLTTSGSYWVEVNNGCATIREEFEIVNDFPAIKDLIYIPNAFSPNDDQANDLFKGESELELITYELSVYDRWGNLVHRAIQLDDGWDGRLQNRKAPIGVYAWILNVQVMTCNGMKEMMQSGDVTLLR